jgi:hypothetical protein
MALFLINLKELSRLLSWDQLWIRGKQQGELELESLRRFERFQLVVQHWVSQHTSSASSSSTGAAGRPDSAKPLGEWTKPPA